MLDDVARELGASEHDLLDPIDSHILRGVCLVLPILQSRDDVQVHVHTRNGICALATWFSRLLGFAVEVTQRQGDNQNSQPSIVRLGRRSTRIDVKINAVSEQNPCVILIGLKILTEINSPALLAEVGDSYKDKPKVLKVRRGQHDYRINQDGNIFEYEKSKTFLRIDFNFWLDKKVHGLTRRPVKGLGRKMLECAANAFPGATGKQGREAWIRDLKLFIIGMALEMAAHFQKCSVQLLSDDSITTNDIHPPTNDDNENFAVGNQRYFAPHRVLEVAHLIFDTQRVAGIFSEQHQSAVENMQLENPLLDMVKDLSVLLLTFANIIELDSCIQLPLDCDFSLLDDQALVRRLRTWDGSSSIRVQENEWFEIVAKLLVGRLETVNTEILNSTSLLSDHGWSIYRPKIDLRRDPSDIGKSLPVIVSPATGYLTGSVIKHS